MANGSFKTVGELKKLLADIPDNTPIVQYHSDMERSGYMPGGYLRKEAFNPVTKQTWDRFDGTDYSYTSYEMVYNENQKTSDTVEAVIL